MKGINGIEVKPLLQQIFENLFSEGLRNFCFVTGRAKRSIEDHFTPDLTSDKIPPQLEKFYNLLHESNIMWVNQLIPKGFGDAVSVSKPYIGESNFILHAGDVAIFPTKTNPISKLISLAKNVDIEAAILLKNVNDPERHGIATVKDDGSGLLQVNEVIEKPDKPQSNLGIMPVYMFRNSIFTALEKTKPGKNNEIQITDAIQKLISLGKKVVAIQIYDDLVLDVGTPESFKSALNQSYDMIK